MAGGYEGRLGTLSVADGFRALTGAITSADLTAVWAASTDDVWAVGAAGTILHGDGAGLWQKVASPTTAALADVWGSGPHDVWAVGEGGAALHWDGDTWTASSELADLNLSAVAGTAPDDVWAAQWRLPAVLAHFDGRSWSRVNSDAGDRYAQLAPIARDDLWVVGSKSLLRWNGKTLDAAPGPVSGESDGVQVFADDDIWAFNGARWVYHFDGSTWRTVNEGYVYHPGKTAGYGPTLDAITRDEATGEIFFLMNGEYGPDQYVARMSPIGGLDPLPKLYTATAYSDLFVRDGQIWVVGPQGMIEHGYLPAR